MREPQNCEIKYCGFSAPADKDELTFEILGLENLIKRAEERISTLRQTSFLVGLAIENKSENLKDLFIGDDK
jgi:hypothetical protein